MDSSRRPSPTKRQPTGSSGSNRTTSTRDTRHGSDRGHPSNRDSRTTHQQIGHTNNKQAISRQPTISHSAAQSTSGMRSSDKPTSTTAGIRRTFADQSRSGGAQSTRPSSSNHQLSSSSLSLNRNSKSFSDFYSHRNINSNTGASLKSFAAGSLLLSTVPVSHSSGKSSAAAGNRKNFDLFGSSAVQRTSSNSYELPTTTAGNRKSFAVFGSSDAQSISSSSGQHRPSSSSSLLSSNQPNTFSNFYSRENFNRSTPNFAAESLLSSGSVSYSSGILTTAGNDRTSALFGSDTDRSSSSSSKNEPSFSSTSATRLHRK